MSEENKMNNVCCYCESIFKSKYTLERHQKTSKKCLKIQYGKKTITYTHNCEYCNYKTNLKQNYASHLNICKNRKEAENKRIEQEKEAERKKIQEAEELEKQRIQNVEKENIKMKEEIIRLQTEKEMTEKFNKELKKEAFKPRTINNTTLFNLQINHSMNVLSPYEELERNFKNIVNEEFTYDLFKKGLAGISIFLHKLLSYKNKEWLISYENAKQNFHKKINNEIKTDNTAVSFIGKLFPYIKKMNKKYHIKMQKETEDNADKFNKLNNKYREIQNIGVDGSVERNKCIKILSKKLCVSTDQLKMISMNGYNTQNTLEIKENDEDDESDGEQEPEDESSNEEDEEDDPFLNPPSDDENTIESLSPKFMRKFDSDGEEIMDNYLVA